MKRVVLTAALCMAVTAAFAQKKAVSQAEGLVKTGTTDASAYTEARSLIQGAMTDAESKDDPKTWYVAGFIEDQQFSGERTKQVLGQQPDEKTMYEALGSILPYFKKAYELDQLPNEKGKVKPKYTKNIKSTLSANHVYYINGGAYYFDQKDYAKAYDFFQQYLEISDMDMFKDTQTAARDSNFMTVQFYAAVAATQLHDSPKAIAALERAKSTDYRQNDVYQYLCYEYEQAKDSVNLEKTLKEGMEKFPQESYYLMSLINTYIYSNRSELAIEYLNTAIAKDPNNAQLYDVMGRVYENVKDMDKAEEYFMKAYNMDQNNVDVLSNLGRVYYNQGVNKLGEANNLSDSKQYQEESAKAKALFEKALPYFEKAHQLDATNRECMIALRGIYYNLNMGDKFDAIEAEMNK